MECMGCWFKNPDADFDPNYPSESESAGLAGTTDDEYDRNIYGEISEHERSQLKILKKNTKRNRNNNRDRGHHNDDDEEDEPCSQCSINQQKIATLTKLLNEQQKEEKIAVRKLKKKYNKLIEKYMINKKQLIKLSRLYSSTKEEITTYETEIKRLSSNNGKILKEKHSVAKERDDLKTNNLNLQKETNTFHRKIYELKMKNKRLQTEFKLAEERTRIGTQKLMRKISGKSSKQEKIVFGNKTAAKSLKNIHEHIPDDNDSDSVRVTRRRRSKSVPNTESNINPSDDDAAAVAGDVATLNLIPIDENKEESSSASQKTTHVNYIGNEPMYLRTTSNGSSDAESSYSYDDDGNNTAFIVRSPSTKDVLDLGNKYDSYTTYYSNTSNVTTPRQQSVNAARIKSPKRSLHHPDLSNAKSNISNGGRSVDTPISPLTSAPHSRYDSVFEIQNATSLSKKSNILLKSNNTTNSEIYIDSDGVDMKSDDENDNKFKIKIDSINGKNKINSINSSKTDRINKQLNELRQQLNYLKNNNKQNKSSKDDSDSLNTKLSIYSTQSNDSNHSMDSNDTVNSTTKTSSSLKRTLSESSINFAQSISRHSHKKTRSNSMPLSETEPIDLKRTQRINEKMQLVSLENTALKHKNNKLSKDIKDLKKQLVQIKNENTDKNEANDKNQKNNKNTKNTKNTKTKKNKK